MKDEIASMELQFWILECSMIIILYITYLVIIQATENILSSHYITACKDFP